MQFLTINPHKHIKLYSYYDIEQVAEQQIKDMRQYSSTIDSIDKTLVNLYNLDKKLSSTSDNRHTIDQYRTQLIDQKEQLHYAVINSYVIINNTCIPLIFVNYFYDLKEKKRLIEKYKDSCTISKELYDKNIEKINNCIRTLLTKQPLIEEYVLNCT